MQNKYDVVIGIEIHLELNSKIKMFSPGKVTLNAKPNTAVHQNDIGLLGTLPIVNKKCIELALQACKILNLKIDPILRFDRKNYTYFDLAKGYQITQQFFPIGKDGNVIINLPNNIKKNIELERMHIEEDTAKQFSNKNEIFLDYNRSGIGLIEIVTKPIIKNELEAALFVSELQQIISYNKISNAKMNEGSMRCDINISLKPKNSKKLGEKVEIKNLNSINNIKLAIQYEIERQTKLLNNNEKIQLQTRKFDEEKKITILMRKKDTSVDYHFFPEPNINPIKISKKFIENSLNKLKTPLIELRKKLKTKYNLDENQIKVLTQNDALLFFFLKIVENNTNYSIITNYFFTDVLSFLNKNNKNINETHLTVDNFIILMNNLETKKISSNQAKDILKTLFIKDVELNKLINTKTTNQIEDDSEINSILEKIISENKDMLTQYEIRKERVLKFYMGKVMQKTKGKINPIKAKNLLEKLIQKINK